MFKPWTAPIIQSYPVQSFTTSDLSKKLHRPSLCSKSSEASYTIRFPKVSQRKRSSYEPRAEIEANFASFAFILREFISANHNIHWSSHTIIIHVVFPIWSQGYRWCMLMLVSKCLKYMLIYAYMFLFLHFLLIFTVYNIHYIFVIYIYIYDKYMFSYAYPKNWESGGSCSGSEDSGLTERRNGLGGLWRSHAIAICGHGHGDSGT